MEKRIALSWSGGKDSCLALDTLVKDGYKVVCLMTTAPEETGRTFAHGEKLELVKAQAASLNIPIEFVNCTLEHYTDRFIETLLELKEKYDLNGIAYGDLYLDEHREWGEQVAAKAAVEAIYPLWMMAHEAKAKLQTFVQSGFKAVVIRVRKEKLDDTWLGRQLDEAFLRDISNENVCPMGEAGEYHTFVYDGPLFKKRIELSFGEIEEAEHSKRLEIAEFKVFDK